MRDVLRTNDPVELSLATALLKDADIEHVVMDGNISILEGSIGIFPRRLMVLDEDYRNARELLQAAEILESDTNSSTETSE
ncbi:MAG: DUF2007 domain-containing protein [Alphaproteobacteria bacterium]|nr:DUF2007 domain-containing protein [Alphaproteobacteria bacterium]